MIFNTLLSKRIASIVLVVLISSSLFLGANAYADGKIFEWIVDTFEKYTSFNVAEQNELNKEKLGIEISYIPKGFELVDRSLLEDSDTYYYSNQDKVLFIVFIYESIPSEMNTEGAKISKFEIEGCLEKRNEKLFCV